MKKRYEFLREHAMKIINFKKNKMKLLTKEQQESYENAKICYICKEKFQYKYLKDKKHHKVRDHCHYTGEYRGAVHSICNLKYSVPIAFYDGSSSIVIEGARTHSFFKCILKKQKKQNKNKATIHSNQY